MASSYGWQLSTRLKVPNNMTIKYTIENRRGSTETAARPTSVRPPRITFLLALAYRFDGLVRSGVVKNFAELARLGRITRARVTQIMNLLNLAPEIQEYLLWLPSESHPAPIERDLRRIAAEVSWDRQRILFCEHKKKPPR